jgi:DNA polymerase III subunit delta
MSVIDDFKKVVKDVRERKFKPLYLLHGEEDFFIDRVEEEIRTHALEEHERDFNQTILYGRDTDAEQVRDACVRFPMMAERQLIVVREAQTWRPDQWDKLEPYAKNPTPTTVLVLCHKHKKIDGRKGFSKTATKQGVVFLSDKLKDDKLPGWIQGYVKHHGRQIGAAEAQLLADHLGSDLGKVTGEVEKLCLVSPPGGKITSELIQRYVGISKEYNIFELQNAIGAGDHFKVMRIANVFANDPKEHPLVVTLEMLHRYFAKLAQVHGSADKTEMGLASALKVPPFFVKDYTAGARRYGAVKLREIQHHLRQADLRSKGVGGSVGDGEVLQELLEKVMS